MKKFLSIMLAVCFLLTITTGCESNRQQADEKSSTNTMETKKEESDMQIQIQGENDETVIFQLNDSTAASSLYDQLPMTIDVEDYSDDEKIFYPDKKLDTSKTPMAKGPIGTLAYYEPGGDVVMYYDDCGGASGLYALGEAISGIDQISQLSGLIEITKYSENTKQDDDMAKQNEDTQPTVKKDETFSIEQSDGMHHIQIAIGSKTFTASLYDNDTVRELLRRFPMSLQMDELHGNEKYYYFSEGLSSSAQSVSQIYTGDLKLFGNDCLVLFYKDFPTSFSYTSLGQIENPQGLSEALGNGSIQIQFRLIE